MHRRLCKNSERTTQRTKKARCQQSFRENSGSLYQQNINLISETTIVRILHAAQMRIPNAGIVHQMEYENEAAIQLGLTWQSRIYCPSQDVSPVVVKPASLNSSSIAFRRDFFSWLNTQVAQYDLVLLRYSMYDPLQSLFVKKCPIPVVSMHHTMDIPELRSARNMRGHILANLEYAIGRYTLSKVKGVAAVTNEIGCYQKERSRNPSIPIFHYPNGAIYTNDSVIQSNYESTEHEFLYLSSQFYPWMGLDLLVKASKNSTENYKIHIVGRLKDRQIEDLRKDKRFIIHGHLGRQEIEKLISKCSIGLSTFAIERKNFTEGNTLKVMEYLKSGLPVYAGYKDILDVSFPYYKQGPANMDKILEYADKVRDVKRETISQTARPTIDKKVVLSTFYRELCDVFQRHV